MKAKTAYDYRRYIELVQVLAMEDCYPGIHALCKAWNVNEVDLYPHGDDMYDTIRALAKAVIEYHRAENERE